MSDPTEDVTVEPKPEQRITITISEAAPVPEMDRPRLLPCPRCRSVVQWPYIHTCSPGSGGQLA